MAKVKVAGAMMRMTDKIAALEQELAEAQARSGCHLIRAEKAEQELADLRTYAAMTDGSIRMLQEIIVERDGELAEARKQIDLLKGNLAAADEGLRKSPTMKFWQRAE